MYSLQSCKNRIPIHTDEVNETDIIDLIKKPQ